MASLYVKCHKMEETRNSWDSETIQKHIWNLVKYLSWRLFAKNKSSFTFYHEIWLATLLRFVIASDLAKN